MIFDSHAHYNDSRFDPDRDSVLSGLAGHGVGYVMNACSSAEEFEDIKKIIEKYSFIYGAAGVHPHEAESMADGDLTKIAAFAAHPKVKAIGEIGLDYYYDNSPRDTQRFWFSQQVDLAVQLDMPIIIHDRDAHADTMDILRKHDVRKIGGVFHCYTGSAEMAKEVLDMNLYIAFGGSLTFKKAQKPVEVARSIPLDRIVIETDCPYLTPEPHRGKRNSSEYLTYIAAKLAEIKGVSAEEVIKITAENAKKVFRIEG